MLATVLFAHGTPMLLAGDEFGRSQHGNNNAYCHDNELSWLNWKQAESPDGAKLIRFVSRLIALRRIHPVLRSRHFMHGKEQPAPGIADIDWFDHLGRPISSEAWNNPEERIIVLRRAAREEDTISALTLLLNPTEGRRTFFLPEPHLPVRVLIDTDLPDAPERDLDGAKIEVAARSAVLVGGSYPVAP
jgi:glycogen operon protein